MEGFGACEGMATARFPTPSAEGGRVSQQRETRESRLTEFNPECAPAAQLALNPQTAAA